MSEIRMELQNLARQYSNRASLFNVGRTYEGENQIGIKVTNGDGRSKPVVWIDGGIHAREWISPATVMYFMNKMLTETTDRRVNEVLWMVLLWCRSKQKLGQSLGIWCWN